MKVVSFLALATLIVAGCGIQKVAEDTRDGVNKSNQTQKDLYDTVERTRKLTDELKTSLQKAVTLEQMFRPENTKVLAPPTRIMPWAELFAKEVTVEEVARLTYLLLKDAENSPADNPTYGQISLTVMGAIAGLVPEEKVDAVLKEQVEQNGRFADAALSFALLRYNFMRDFLFKPILGSRTLNIGSLKEATKYYGELVNLVKRPYSNRYSIEVAALSLSLKLNPEEIVKLGLAARAKFEPVLGNDKSDEVQKLLKVFGTR